MKIGFLGVFGAARIVVVVVDVVLVSVLQRDRVLVSLPLIFAPVGSTILEFC